MATYAGKTYTNGHVPASILAPLDGENYGRAELRKDAAASWNRARAEVKAKTGIVLTVRGWNRTYAEQVTFYEQRHRKARAGDRVCCRWNGVPYVFTGTAHAAPPGTSNHGWGLAVDVDDFGGVDNFNHPRRVASIAILKKHGWTDDEGRGLIREPWHLVYNPAKDTQKNATPTPEDDDMPTAEEIAKAVWNHKARVPSTLVPYLGKTNTMRAIVTAGAMRSERIDQDTSRILREVAEHDKEN